MQNVKVARVGDSVSLNVGGRGHTRKSQELAYLPLQSSLYQLTHSWITGSGGSSLPMAKQVSE